MDIKYLGHSSFLFRNKQAKLITDPFYPEYTGLKFPKTEADIVTSSHDHKDHNYIEGIKGSPLVLTWPGEYEKGGVRIKGFATFHDEKEGSERGNNVVYKFEIEGMSILHCGDLGHLLSSDMVDAIGNIDVLCVPVGGVYTITPAQALKVVNSIEPSIIIPMHYKQDGLNPSVFEALQPVDAFLKEISAEGSEVVDKLTLKKESLDGSEQKVVVMSI